MITKYSELLGVDPDRQAKLTWKLSWKHHFA